MALITVDFDDTLSEPAVQEFVRWVLGKGIRVKIVTRRHPDTEKDSSWLGWGWNNDLYRIAEGIGIKRDDIISTGLNPKFEYLNRLQREGEGMILFHLDDYGAECDMIDLFSNITSVLKDRKENWIGQCESIINKYLTYPKD